VVLQRGMSSLLGGGGGGGFGWVEAEVGIFEEAGAINGCMWRTCSEMI
jgi:hypothetical protein